MREGRLRLVRPFPQRITDSESAPSTVAVYSRAADCRAEVIFIPDGDDPESYTGKNVRGKIVLSEGGRHENVHQLAVHRYGALGTIHFNERRGAFNEAEGIYWGNIFPWEKGGSRESTFGFNVSTNQGEMLRKLLESGEKVEVDAFIDAENLAGGSYDLATAVIPGSRYPEEEFIFYSHLDHPKPGAHDNASGNAVMLEIARSLSYLIKSGHLPAPARSIRFMWIPHMNGLNMYFHRYPEKIGKVKGGCNIDCVGLDISEFPSQLFVAYPPHSLPSVLTDITRIVVERFNRQMRMGNVMGSESDLLFAPEGSRNLEQVLSMPYLGFSDEYTTNTRTLDMPSIYFFNDPLPPRHNQINYLKYLDRTSLRRVAFLGAAISYAFTALDEGDLPLMLNEIKYGGELRILGELRRAKNAVEKCEKNEIHAGYASGLDLMKWGKKREAGMTISLKEMGDPKGISTALFDKHDRWLDAFGEKIEGELRAAYDDRCQRIGETPRYEVPSFDFSGWGKRIPLANPEIKGSTGYFSHFFEARLGEKYLAKYPGVRRSFRYGNVGYYETLNYIDGRNSIADIYRAVRAELWRGDYPKSHYLGKEEMLQFLFMLRDAGVIRISGAGD